MKYEENFVFDVCDRQNKIFIYTIHLVATFIVGRLVNAWEIAFNGHYRMQKKTTVEIEMRKLILPCNLGRPRHNTG